MAKKKVLYVITKSNWGGAQRYVYDLATNLPEDYEPVVAAGGCGRLAERLKEKGVRFVEVPSLARDVSVGNDIRAFWELYKLYRHERPWLVHLNSSKAGGVGAAAGRLARVPRVVFTVHGWAFNEPVPALAKLFRWVASLATILLAHRVISVSHFDRIHAPLGLETKTVHNGIPPLDFLPRAEARSRLIDMAQIPADSFIIGTLAELHKNKGIDILLEATAITKDSHVIVLGEGEERHTLQELINMYGIEERVHMVGFVDNAARLMKGFDIFVLPSRKEGLSYTILEAGAAGLPVVSTIVGGTPEMIEDQLSGILVPPYEAAALADALNELQQSPNTRARLGEALKLRVDRYFALRGMVKHTLDVYES